VTKFGKLWSSNKKVIGVNVDPWGAFLPKLYFQSDLGRWEASSWALSHIPS